MRESVVRKENTAEYWREAKGGCRHDFMKQSLCVDLVTQLIQSFTWHFTELLLLASPTMANQGLTENRDLPLINPELETIKNLG